MQPKLFAVAVLCVLTLAVCPFAQAGTLRIGTATVQGDTVTIPVMLDGDVGSGVSSVDFKFTYDPAVLEPVDTTAGAAATAAGKQVQTNTLEPGQYKVVMFGLNQATIASGEVAQIVMKKVGEIGSTDVSVVEPNFADPNAVAIPSSGSTETLRLDAQQGQGEENKTTEKPVENTQNKPENTPETTPSTTTGAGIPQVTEGTDSTTTGATKAPAAGSGQTARVGAGNSGAAPAPDRATMQRLAKAIEAAGQARSAMPTPTAPGTDNTAIANGTAPSETPKETTETNKETLATLDNTNTNAAVTPAAPAAPGDPQKMAALPSTAVPAVPAVPAAKPTTPEAPTSKSTPLWLLMGIVVVVVAGLFVVRHKLFS